jgi:serine protease Do
MLKQSIQKLQKKTKHVSVLGIIVMCAFIGGVAGGIFVTPLYSQAGILQDIFGGFVGQSVQDQSDTLTQTPQDLSVVDYEHAVVTAVKSATPAVVSVVVSKDLPVIKQCPYDPFANLPDQFKQFFGGGTQLYQPCQQGTSKQEIGGGSGFIVTSDGLIVTNKHVVEDEQAEYSVVTNDGKTYAATVKARHPLLDIAVLKIDASGLPTLNLGDSSDITLGQTVIAIGNALGEFGNSVSRGVVSGLSRTITASTHGGATENLENVIQTDAAINPGNSGGPLLNIQGNVIGINVATVSGAQNIGFAIPINAAVNAIESVKTTGEITVAFLGVHYITLNADNVKQLELPIDHGAHLFSSDESSAIEKDSPAEAAGLKDKDIIVAIDGEQLTSDHSLASIIAQKRPGQSVSLDVWRGGQMITLSTTLAERQ